MLVPLFNPCTIKILFDGPCRLLNGLIRHKRKTFIPSFDGLDVGNQSSAGCFAGWQRSRTLCFNACMWLLRARMPYAQVTFGSRIHMKCTFWGLKCDFYSHRISKCLLRDSKWDAANPEWLQHSLSGVKEELCLEGDVIDLSFISWRLDAQIQCDHMQIAARAACLKDPV